MTSTAAPPGATGATAAGPGTPDEARAARRRLPRLPRPRLPRPRLTAETVLGVMLVLAGQSLVLADLDVPVLRPVLAGVLLVVVPVLLLTRRTFGRLGNPLLSGLYAIGVTVLGLIVVPLALNTALPPLGVGAPLARPVLVAASTVADVLLILFVRPRPGLPLVDLAAVRRRVVTLPAARLDPAITLGVAAVVLAVAGAVRLNNGLGGGVAIAAHVAAVAALAAAVLARRESRARGVVVVYLAGLALLLGTSMRGWFITGHDIQNEYLAFLYTNQSHHWVMSAYPTPYNACLSVNILPSVLVEYLGVGGVFVFKVLMQLLFALVPVCVYASSRRMVSSSRVAVLAATLFVVFPTFYTDMPFLVRQEVAYLFVVLTLLAATQRTWPRRSRQFSTYAFGVGVILSHYSTTYVLVMTLVIALIGTAAGAIVRGRRERRKQRRITGRHLRERARRLASPPVLLRPVAVLLLAATAWAWSSPATHSGGHLAETVNKLTEAFIHGNAETGSSDLKYSVFGGGGVSPDQRFAEYVKEAARIRGTGNDDRYVFADPQGAVADPPVVDREYLPLTPTGRAVDDVGLNVRGVNALLRTGAAALFQLLLVLGLIALVLHTVSTRRISREQFWLVLGSVGALASVVVVPGLSANYGVLRAFQQTLLFAAPVLAIGLVAVTTRLRRASVPAAAGVVTVMGLVLTGAQPALLGGYYATLSQSDSGQYYDLLYVRSPQLSAARWLAATTRGQGLQTVAAADIVSVTRLQMFLPRSVAVTGNYLPLQLTKDTYVFLGPQQAERGQSTVFYTGDLLTYRYPVGAIDRRMDLVYSTSGTRIYR